MPEKETLRSARRMLVPEDRLSRPPLLDRLLQRVPQPGPALVVGPPGAGKTTLLLEAARALSERGWIAVYLDLMGAASSPERFAVAALEALPAESFGALLGRATQIRRLATPEGDGSAAVQALMTLWGSLVVYSIWRRLRLRGRPSPTGRLGTLFILTMLHFAIAALVCLKLRPAASPARVGRRRRRSAIRSRTFRRP